MLSKKIRDFFLRKIDMGKQKLDDYEPVSQLLTYVNSHYELKGVNRALKKMTTEARQQFFRLTGFEVPQPPLKKLGGSPFFQESARRKRKAEEVDFGGLEANGKRRDNGKQEDEHTSWADVEPQWVSRSP